MRAYAAVFSGDSRTNCTTAEIERETMKLFRTTLACAAVSAAALAATGFTPVSAASDAAPLALQGVLPNGAAVDRLEVYAIADDADIQPGQSLDRTLVPATFTRSGKAYSVGIEPSSVPAEAVDRGGVVNLELHFVGKRSTWVTFVSDRIVEDTSQSSAAAAGGSTAPAPARWVDPTEALSDAAPDAGLDTSGGVATVRATAVTSDMAVPQLPASELGKPVVTKQTSGSLTPHAVCDYQYVKDSNRSTTIATSYPYGVSKSWLDVDYTQGGTYGLAFNTGSGFSAQGTQFASGGWGATWGKSSSMRSYRIGVNYHYYKSGCTAAAYWSPHIETGGATYNTDGLTRPGWNTYCANVSRGVTWKRYLTSGNAYQYGQGVKFKDVIGIDLSVKKEYSAHHTLYYYIDGSNPKKLCGNNDYPSQAGKIVERVR